jgi:hypothetical protein
LRAGSAGRCLGCWPLEAVGERSQGRGEGDPEWVSLLCLARSSMPLAAGLVGLLGSHVVEADDQGSKGCGIHLGRS